MRATAPVCRAKTTGVAGPGLIGMQSLCQHVATTSQRPHNPWSYFYVQTTSKWLCRLESVTIVSITTVMSSEEWSIYPWWTLTWGWGLGLSFVFFCFNIIPWSERLKSMEWWTQRCRAWKFIFNERKICHRPFRFNTPPLKGQFVWAREV